MRVDGETVDQTHHSAIPLLALLNLRKANLREM